jgi:hypothetical protein
MELMEFEEYYSYALDLLTELNENNYVPHDDDEEPQ